MRPGNCTVQQTLTAEAASVLKHSLSLARSRGHAQATPLHVAATLLTSRSSLLRRACLNSQPPNPNPHLHSSHPLQGRALELCFNVALNRLPTTPGPLLHAQPSLSNALIAALKRAQAHQRRGCIEQQHQQPLLTIKVELEQLVLSILDDPSVSRVMREAGFSSTCVKNNIEDSSASSVFHCYTSSAGVFSSPCSPNSHAENRFLSYASEKPPLLFSPQKKVSTDSWVSVKDDMKLVLEVLLSKKRKNTVIVGDCVSITEAVACEVMGRVERGEVPLELKKMQFVKFEIAPVCLRLMKKEDVEMKIKQLKQKVDSISGEGGAIIYAGDLRWTVEESAVREGEYNAVEHVVREIGRMVGDYSNSNNSKKVWLMGTATYQTYMRCQMRQPPLEIEWALQAVSVPSGGLALSLHASSIQETRITSQLMETKPLINNLKDEQDKLNCCPECTSSYHKEAQLFKSTHNKNLPPWLHPQPTNTNQKDQLIEMRRKYNGICQSLNHQGRNNLYNNSSGQALIGRTNFNTYVSSYPWWPTQSNSISFTHSTYTSNFVPKTTTQQIAFNFCKNQPNLDSLKNTQGKELKVTLALGNSFFSDTGKWENGSSDLCKLLQENVPWQSETIGSIVDILVDSKSTSKGVIWLMIEGNDTIGKRRLALAIAESVLGSADLLLYLNTRNKKHTELASYSDTITRASRNQEKVVALVEDVDFADTQFLKLVGDGFTGQRIFILTRGGDFMSYESDCVIQMKLEVTKKETTRGDSFGKRKAEWEISSNKNLENGNKGEKRVCFSRQSSLNSSLDLNIKAEDENEEKSGDLMRGETVSDKFTAHEFVDVIKNKFVFERNESEQKREIREAIELKMYRCFEKVIGGGNRNGFRIEEKVIEEIVDRYGSIINSKLEGWVKDIFETSLKTVKNGGKEGVEVTLCFDGIVLENGYMGSFLPKVIQVSFMD